MALSNIFNEPKRELTETAVGALVVAGVVGPLTYADYWLAYKMDPNQIVLGMLVGFMCILFGSVVLSILLFAIHASGEAVCNALEKKGIFLRPKTRR